MWLELRHRKRIIVVLSMQITLSILDLLGVVLIGIVGALSVNSLQSTTPSPRILDILSIVGMKEFPLQKQIAILGVVSVIVLVGRSMASLIITKKIIYFFSRRSADLSISLTKKLFAQPLLIIQEKSSQEILYALTRGTEFLMIQVLGTCTVLVADISVLGVLMVGLVAFDPLTAFSTFIIFTTVAIALHKSLSARAGELGEQNAKVTIQGNQAINESLVAFREAFVSNRFIYYIKQIEQSRKGLAEISGHVNFMPYISKYVIEATVILGALFISGIQIIIWDAAHAVAALGIFLAAGTRIGPSVLRLQQGLVYIRNSLGTALPTVKLMEELKHSESLVSGLDNLQTDHGDFSPRIEISKLSFCYPGAGINVIDKLDLLIPSGSYVAIVGTSGVGKSTLIDLVLGIIEPTLGQVLLSEMNPKDAIERWPGAIGYVPQDVAISDGTILENVLMGYSKDALSSEAIYELLRTVELENFVRGLDKELETQVGERGSKLSGGQRQRLGIARALVTKPKILILDEATSALDGETEAAISDSLLNLKNSVTIIAIAHRLRTVKNADFILYLKPGGKYEVGTYQELLLSSQSFRQTMQIEF
jgi:ABC-type multidrug transport system fused ATPase/permease subunit